ncbi:6-phosphogluconolactonase/Glucosamine-6-phosphate isomerase/deaminase [Microbacterium testaceum StLB037]|uniref:6-phosphogluconolactonase/Glucosamine-6-phosphate isomerase/deaminase n=1 Tax=Microbacterium testaceum (strain StLB037) TaxID=979556 RepID=E8N8F6_MICTS|nr:glucosamine-6-phosphate deaminase [Microbacterium testaceum]BAJ74401.1 6-phosphogluconolactonase/Glucosamine-6-phosphate isomerase/deaminase [Microbacterium testaceum StLB037]
MAEVVITRSADEASALAADHVARAIAAQPRLVLGVATGSTPERFYRHLARRIAEDGLDTSGVRAFALDEYVGLPADHPESYAAVIERTVTTPLGLDPAHVHVPDGRAADPFAAAAAYDRAIDEAGGVDIQILGIGRNGHIGFNEPGSSLGSRTRVKTLAASTREANARFFADPADVPVHCITQGIGTIREARHLLLLAFGADKSTALAGAVEGPVSASLPGSAIQLHAHVTVLADEDAAQQLTLADAYREAWALKPAAQGF